ncbi:hypothetical protein ElyMa_001384600 [Elysia marginata]|uniref:Uncharacterized protein n=1 Tax=Elysia marginata TaxID=1093978 RepID=A0AAV4ITF2_9GAST|nr:hypothetical protein ElyMa_001384600 [Elysia marginata]
MDSSGTTNTAPTSHYIQSFATNHHVTAMLRLVYSTDPEGDTRYIQSYWANRWIRVRLGMIQPGVQTRTDFSLSHTFSSHGKKRKQATCTILARSPPRIKRTALLLMEVRQF